jgi:uncharacterized protein (TIGR03067 family)
MSTNVIAFLACGLLLGASDLRQRDVEQELVPFQGTWKVTSVKGFRRDKTKEQLAELTMRVRGHRIICRYGDKTAEATFKLGGTRSGQAIDITVTKGPEAVKGKTFHARYYVEGPKLRIAYRNPPGERPAEFTRDGQKDVFEVDFKKVEAKEHAATS